MIGPYRIERELGRGGMGVVYLAHDTRLDRTVALKALPEELAQDPDRLARFEREAKLLASLNHPNIATIYGVEESEGRVYLALEHIEGESLADRLSRGALSVEESMELCLQIATGLEAAHERGVIHRDLKPGNVMVTPGDQVKIVDFGLAKGPIGTESGQIDSPMSSPTITSPAVAPGTMGGVILGTAPYLSPEQARGKPVDRRTDIWSFGCILYECLTGRRTFQGETVSDTVAAILKQEPNWGALPKDLSERVRELLQRCLEKDPRQRFRDIGEAPFVLVRTRTASGSREDGLPRRASPAFWVTLAVLILGIAAGGYWFIRSSSWPFKSNPSLKASLPLPPGFRLDSGDGGIAISPDEKTIAMAGSLNGQPSRIWIRSLNSLEVKAIPGTEDGSYPFWSPDGKNLGFFANSQLRRVPLSDGPVQSICDAADGRGGTWNRNGVIVFDPGPRLGLQRVQAGGGQALPIQGFESKGSRLPRFLPDGRHLLYFDNSAEKLGVWTLDISSGRSRPILGGNSDAIPVEPGYLFFLRDGDLLVQKFDLSSSRLEREPVPIASGIPLNYYRNTGPYAASKSLIVYGGSEFAPKPRMIRFNPRGNAVDSIGEPADFHFLRFSPDGTRFGAIVQQSRGFELRIYDARTGELDQAFPAPGPFMAWSHTGREIAFATRNDISFLSTGGEAPRTPIPTNGPVFLSNWSPDGKYLLYWRNDQQTRSDIWICPLDEPTKARPLIATPALEAMPVLSPNGEWMLYVSDKSGRPEYYLTAFPTPGRSWQVSRDGASGAVSTWLQDGRTIVTLSLEGQLLATGVTFSGGEPHFSKPVPLCGTMRSTGGDIDPTGHEYIGLVQQNTDAASLTVITNWRELLESR